MYVCIYVSTHPYIIIIIIVVVVVIVIIIIITIIIIIIVIIYLYYSPGGCVVVGVFVVVGRDPEASLTMVLPSGGTKPKQTNKQTVTAFASGSLSTLRLAAFN